MPAACSERSPPRASSSRSSFVAFSYLTSSSSRFMGMADAIWYAILQIWRYGDHDVRRNRSRRSGSPRGRWSNRGVRIRGGGGWRSLSEEPRCRSPAPTRRSGARSNAACARSRPPSGDRPSSTPGARRRRRTEGDGVRGAASIRHTPQPANEMTARAPRPRARVAQAPQGSACGVRARNTRSRRAHWYRIGSESPGYVMLARRPAPAARVSLTSEAWRRSFP